MLIILNQDFENNSELMRPTFALFRLNYFTMALLSGTFRALERCHPDITSALQIQHMPTDYSPLKVLNFLWQRELVEGFKDGVSSPWQCFSLKDSLHIGHILPAITSYATKKLERKPIDNETSLIPLSRIISIIFQEERARKTWELIVGLPMT